MQETSKQWILRMIETHFSVLLLSGLIGFSLILSLATAAMGILPHDPTRQAWWREQISLLVGALLGLLSYQNDARERRPPSGKPVPPAVEKTPADTTGGSMPL